LLFVSRRASRAVAPSAPSLGVIRGKPQHTYDLGHPTAGDSLLTGDLDHLFEVGGHRGAVMAGLGGMDDPEVDLRFDPPQSGSNTGTLREPVLQYSNRRGPEICTVRRWFEFHG